MHQHRRSSLALLLVGVPTALFILHYFTAATRLSRSSHELFIPDKDSSSLPLSQDHLAQLYSSEPPVHKHSIKWTTLNELPETRALAHIPGYTVLENVYSINGTFVLVTDQKSSLPNTEYIISAWADIPGGKTLVGPPSEGHIRIVNRKVGIQLFSSAREIRGTTWLCNNPLSYIDEAFAMGFLRTHFMQEHRAHYNASLLPPRRVLFPKISNRVHQSVPGLASIPRLLFPETTVGFKEDWDDYAFGHRAIIFRTVIITDRGAASRNPVVSTSPEQAALNFELASPLTGFKPTNGAWWARWRKQMVTILGMSAVDENLSRSAFANPVITYVSRQHEQADAWLHEDHHEDLVAALQRLGRKYDFEVNIVNPRTMRFLERIKLLLRTTILMGATGSFLFDAMWMHQKSLLIEFFPDNYLSSKTFSIAKTVGLQYIPWRGSGEISSPDTTALPSNDIAVLQDALLVPSSVDAESLITFLLAKLQQDQGEEDEELR